MPNGHGGHVRFFSVIVLLVIAAGLLAWVRQDAPAWATYIGYLLALPIGERIAHHLHRWSAEEYDGGLATDEERADARKTYLVGAVIYVLGAAVAWHFLTT